MLKGLEYIKDFFTWFIDIVKSIGSMFVSLFQILGVCIDYLKNVLSIVPSWMYVVLVVLVIVCVVYKILGREGNS